MQVVEYMIPKTLMTLFVLLLTMGCGAPTLTSTPTAAPAATQTSQPTTASPTTLAEPTTVPATSAIEAGATATPVLTALDFHEQTFSSTDGKWLVKTELALPAAGGATGGEMYYAKMMLAEVDGPRTWTVLNRWSNWGMGYTLPMPFHWSKDGTAFYYTNRPVPGGCGLFVNGGDLVRVDLATGQSEQVVPDVGLWLSLAPDEQTLAYIGYGGRGLVLRDAAGNEREQPLDYGPKPYQAGKILWSPDQKTLVYTVAHNPCAGGVAEATSLVRVDAATLEQTTLIPEDPRLFTTVEWTEPGRVLLLDKDGKRW